MKQTDPIKREKARLNRIFKGLPKNKYTVVEGLIDQAARLRVMQDDLWKDIEEHGRTEMFAQSKDAEPYERERPSVKQFQAACKNYQTVIAKLVDLTPAGERKSKLDAIMKDDDE